MMTRQIYPLIHVYLVLAGAFLLPNFLLAQEYYLLAQEGLEINWNNTTLLSVDDDWSAYPSVRGYRGDNLTSSPGIDPQEVLGSESTLSLKVNNSNPNLGQGGIAEFELSDPCIALQGSNTADAPALHLYLNTLGTKQIQLRYRLRELDQDNAIQALALQYRIDAEGDFMNIAPAFVADASDGNFKEENIQLTLPPNCENQAQLELRWITSNAQGADSWIGIDDIFVQAQEAHPEIALFADQGTEIISGSSTPQVSEGTDFGLKDIDEASALIHEFHLHNLGASPLTLSTSPNIQLSASAAFQIINYPESLIPPQGQSTFQIQFAPSEIGLHQAQISIANNDPDENPYTFVISGEGTHSRLSDITEDPNFIYPSNIEGHLFQSVDIQNTQESVAVFRFILRDGGVQGEDADNLATFLQEIEFEVEGIECLRSAAIFEGNAWRASLSEKTDSHIRFQDLSQANIQAPDNEQNTFSLRVSFQEIIEDNKQMRFRISRVRSRLEGSQCSQEDAGGAESSQINDRNRLEIKATQLVFLNDISEAESEIPLQPAPEVAAVDLFGNIDADFIGEIELNSIPPLNTGAIFQHASLGLASFPELIFYQAQEETRLLAQHPELTSAQSNVFRVFDYPYETGDWRPRQAGVSFSQASAWESYDGQTWNEETQAPEALNQAPNRIIIDKRNIQVSNSPLLSYPYLKVKSRGQLIIQETALESSQDLLSSEGVLWVEPEGELSLRGNIKLPENSILRLEEKGLLILQSAQISANSQLWQGKENFAPGSLVQVLDWKLDPQANNQVFINRDGQISPNEEGNCFGDLEINLSPQGSGFFLLQGDLGAPNQAWGLCHNLSLYNQSEQVKIYLQELETFSAIRINANLQHHRNQFVLFRNMNASLAFASLEIQGDFIGHENTQLTWSEAANLDTELTLYGDLKLSPDTQLFPGESITRLRFRGEDPQELGIAPYLERVSLSIEEGSQVILSQENLRLAGDCEVQVKGSLDFSFQGSTPLEIEQVAGANNHFRSEEGSHLIITSPWGLNQSGEGNIRGIPTSNRSFNQRAIFHYRGLHNQVSGNALSTASTSKIILIDLEDEWGQFEFSQRVGISDNQEVFPEGAYLEIRRGILLSSEEKSVFGSGGLRMSGGEYRLSQTNTRLPELEGDYQISAGLLHLQADGPQELRGARVYTELKFSGSGDKSISSAIQNLDGGLYLEGDVHLDLGSRTLSGLGSLHMEQGFPILRLAKKNTTLPELEGPYTLSAGQIELYGSNAQQSHSLRGGVEYHRVLLSAQAANQNPYEANILASSSFGIKDKLTIAAPATFQVGSNFTISGSGLFELAPGAGLKYGAAEGISQNQLIGNIQTQNRIFSSEASYYLIGGVEQVGGDGLPSQVHRLSIDKSNGGASLSQNLSITHDLQIRQGQLNLNGYDIELKNGAWLQEDRLSGQIVFDSSLPSQNRGKIYMADDYWMSIAPGQLNDMVGLGLQVENKGENPFDLQVSRYQASFNLPENLNSIPLAFEVQSNQNTVNASLYFQYADVNIEGQAEESLQLFRRKDTQWEAFPTQINPDLNELSTFTSSFSTWTAVSIDQALPVNLVSLKGEQVSPLTAKITWETLGEYNHDYFELFKSKDGQDFALLARVDEKTSDTNVLHQYEFIDFDFQHSAYYRLEQIDQNGSRQSFPPIFIAKRIHSGLRLYPNPVREKVSLLLPEVRSVYEVQLQAIQGQVLWSGEVLGTELERILNAKIPSLAQGFYRLTLQNAQGQYQVSFLKLH